VSVDLIDLSECFVDKDDRDEDGKTFLREASDVSNEKAEVKGDDDEEHDHDPDTDPESQRHEVKVIVPVE